MSLPYMNTVLLNQMIVIISQSFNECFSNDEQAIIGAFLTTLGDMLSLNSAYISYLQDQNSLSKQNQNDYDLLEKSIEKISKVLYNIDNENTPSVCSRYHL